MAQQDINFGTVGNDGTGETPFTAFDKIQDNFDELYAGSGGAGGGGAAYDSVTLLRAAAAPTSNVFVFYFVTVSGNTIAHIAKWNAADTRADDAELIIKPNSISSGNPGRWNAYF